MMMNQTILDVQNLKTSFFTYSGEIKAVRDVSFQVRKGEVIGIVGESGSGKSITALSLLGLLKEPGRVTGGCVLYKNRDLLKLPEKEMRMIRGNNISMIFQDPMTSLNPTLTVGRQVTEVLMVHHGITNKEAEQKAAHLFEEVKIPSPKDRLGAYPHEFSGGMRQRVMIAMALSCEPDLVIADEPTTALDVTIQSQIMKLIGQIQKKSGMSVVLITHDLGVVADVAKNILVMYGGMILEEGSNHDIFYRSRHPYTQGLLNSVPDLDITLNKRLIPIPGSPPDMLNPPVGCPFSPRCRYAMKICHLRVPEYSQLSKSHRSMCWLLHPQAPQTDLKKEQGVHHGR